MKISYFALLPLLLISCEKTENSDESPDSLNKGDSICIGDYSNMLVNVYDRNVVIDFGEKQNASFSIDVDDDDKLDLKFNVSHVGGAEWSVRDIAIQCLDTIFTVFSKTISDTVFFKNYCYTAYKRPDDTLTKVFDVDEYYCVRINEDDSVYSISERKNLSYLPLNDYLVKQDSFSYIMNYTLYSESYSMIDDPVIYESQDTIIYMDTRSYLDCRYLEKERIFYLGFKKENRLGWIKILISSSNSIWILESAFQNKNNQ